MSGPTTYRTTCPAPGCQGWVEWTDWDTDEGACSQCGKLMGQATHELRQSEDHALLVEFCEWMQDDHLITDNPHYTSYDFPRYNCDVRETALKQFLAQKAPQPLDKEPQP